MLARKIILGFGFAVLMPLLIYYGIDTFCPAPDREKFYDEINRTRLQESEDTPDAATKAQLRARREGMQQAFDAEQDQSERIHFFIGAPLGILITLLGSFIRAQAIGGGLMLGGIFTFTSGCLPYWTDMSRQGRFAVLLVAFGVLLWIGYQRLAELKQPQKAS